MELSGLPSYRVDILQGQVGLHRTLNYAECLSLMFSPSCLWFVLGCGGPQVMPEWMFHLAPHGQPLYHTFLLATWLSRKEKNTFITTEGLSYNPSLYNYLCLHDMHFSSCKELLGWQHNDFTFSQHENSIPLLLERWDVHAREQNLVPHMQ